jgi:hypothetical protein
LEDQDVYCTILKWTLGKQGKDLEWIQLAQDRDERQALVNIAKNL